MQFATNEVYRVGECNNCGACCMIYDVATRTKRICREYNWKSKLHCKVYGRRPEKCREFPKSPGAIEGLQRWCGYKFIDEGGFTMDGYTDSEIVLMPIKRS